MGAGATRKSAPSLFLRLLDDEAKGALGMTAPLASDSRRHKSSITLAWVDAQRRTSTKDQGEATS